MLKVNFETLAKDVYGANLEGLLDGSRFYFEPFPMDIDEQDKEKFVNYAKEYDSERTLDKDEVEELTKRAMFSRYETSYIDDMYSRVKEHLVEVIIDDFLDLNEGIIYDDIQFDLYNEDVTIDEQLDMLKSSFTIDYDEDEDEYIFTGSMKKLALGVISAIHGHGMFRFSSLQEFSGQSEGEELDEALLKKSILSHLFWLKRYNEIYGTGSFSFNMDSYIEHQDSYGSLGDFNFEKEEVEYALEF